MTPIVSCKEKDNNNALFPVNLKVFSFGIGGIVQILCLTAYVKLSSLHTGNHEEMKESFLNKHVLRMGCC